MKSAIKKQRITTGSIVEINIEDQYVCYAQILGKASYAFFDYKTEKRIEYPDVLLDKPVLFIIAVYDDVITNGHWSKVGKLPVREDLQVLPMKFIQDALKSDRFELYNPNTGDITKATKQDCKGLERASVWEAHHVEDRIRDHYNGVPCIWLKDDRELFNN